MVRKLKAWLKKNWLTPEANDFSAMIESFGSVNVDGIIDELKAEGMELKTETVLDVITRYNRKCIDLVLSGHNVSTGLVYMKAMVRGVFYDKTWNPERNHLHVAISQGVDLRNAVAETSVEIMGEHPDPIALFTITDLSTGKTDGSLTLGFNAELKGAYIKITGKDESCGLYLRNVDTSEDVKLEPQYIAINDPSRILFIVPANLSAGTYELRIVTQFTGGGSSLKHPRAVTLGYHVTVG
ncbi:MAG: DUF4469 domain-containing protein [Dysgonamonadaceae bacterium]|jgi:hypothetical protein|nr:DUF4469 domain-containing protein [Dysgonamonadaceae bacterium]